MPLLREISIWVRPRSRSRRRMSEVVSTLTAYAISHSTAMRSHRSEWPTVEPMDRFNFLKALLTSKGMGPTAAAELIRVRASQGNISRFLKREVVDPRGKWTKELPRAMGFDPAALRDDDVARSEALRLGLLTEGVAPPASIKSAREARQARIDPGMLALQIADLMRGYSQSQRETASALFQGAARSPEEAPAIAAALRALLTKRDGTNG